MDLSLNDTIFNCSCTKTFSFDAFINIALTYSKSKTIKFVNAGHPFPLFKSQKIQSKTSSLLVYGRLLGEELKEGEEPEIYLEKEMSLNNGDVIALYSDGLIEREENENHMYKTKQLFKVLEKNQNASVSEIKEKIVKDTMDFYKKYPQTDDITLVVVKVVMD